MPIIILAINVYYSNKQITLSIAHLSFSNFKSHRSSVFRGEIPVKSTKLYFQILLFSFYSWINITVTNFLSFSLMFKLNLWNCYLL
jgi:hypothetical protein